MQTLRNDASQQGVYSLVGTMGPDLRESDRGMKKNVALVMIILLLLLTACGSNGDTAADPTSTPDDTPVEILSVESLREQAAELDGQVVTVRSNYWSRDDSQYLSDIMMESYPPQIPFDLAVILDGEMPESVLDLLTSADDVSPAVVWGEVDVTGEVRVDGDDVRLKIHEAFAVLR